MTLFIQGASNNSSSSSNSDVQNLVEKLFEKINLDLNSNIKNTQSLENDLKNVLVEIAPLKSSLIDPVVQLKPYLPLYVCTEKATVKDAIKYLLIVLMATEKQYQTEIKHAFRLVEMFSALNKRIESNQKKVNYLLKSKKVTI